MIPPNGPRDHSRSDNEECFPLTLPELLPGAPSNAHLPPLVQRDELVGFFRDEPTLKEGYHLIHRLQPAIPLGHHK